MKPAARKRRCSKRPSLEPPPKSLTPSNRFDTTSRQYSSYKSQSGITLCRGEEAINEKRDIIIRDPPPVTQQLHKRYSRATFALTQTQRSFGQMSASLNRRGSSTANRMAAAINKTSRHKSLAKQGRLRSCSYSYETEECILDSLTSRFDGLKITGNGFGKPAAPEISQPSQPKNDKNLSMATHLYNYFITPGVPNNTPENDTDMPISTSSHGASCPSSFSLNLSNSNIEKEIETRNETNLHTDEALELCIPEINTIKRGGSCNDISKTSQHEDVTSPIGHVTSWGMTSSARKPVRRHSSLSDFDRFRSTTKRRNAILP